MRCWKASRNAGWNEGVVKELLQWRLQCKQEWSFDGLEPDYKPAFQDIGYIAALRIEAVCLPVLQSLERLEKSFAAIGRG